MTIPDKAPSTADSFANQCVLTATPLYRLLRGERGALRPSLSHLDSVARDTVSHSLRHSRPLGPPRLYQFACLKSLRTPALTAQPGRSTVGSVV